MSEPWTWSNRLADLAQLRAEGFTEAEQCREYHDTLRTMALEIETASEVARLAAILDDSLKVVRGVPGWGTCFASSLAAYQADHAMAHYLRRRRV